MYSRCFAPWGSARLPLRRRVPPPGWRTSPGSALKAADACAELSWAGKIHRATVTHCEFNREGSRAVDEELLDVSGNHDFEQIDIYNVNNGERFTTYAMRAARGSGIISLNEAAVRRAAVGDLVIIAAYGQLDLKEVRLHKPKLVFVDARNRQVGLRDHIPIQADAALAG